MNIEKFKSLMNEYLDSLKIELNNSQMEQFYEYMNLLIEWNKKINLTAIVEPEDIIIKHFIDSLTVLSCLDKKSKIIDIGTGAGFPGIPIKIAFPETKVVLVDSLNKRINFLNEVIEKLELKDIITIHGRAEDLGRNTEYREKFDISIARAVAPLNILVEYLIPFVKLSGECICMKGNNVQEELEKSKSAITKLGGKIENIQEINLPKTDINREIVLINKIKNTKNKYPRKAGVPSKVPL